jgi:hypothetical protein
VVSTGSTIRYSRRNFPKPALFTCKFLLIPLIYGLAQAFHVPGKELMNNADHKTTGYMDKEEMTTMSSCTNRLIKEGYTENFTIKNVGLEAPSTSKLYLPDEVKINSFYRFEGESDPADSAIVYAIETKDGTKGLLIDSYGAYRSDRVSKFITEVEDITKREASHH